MSEANDLPETEVGRWRAVVTQVDWGGKVMQESWYGHHNPCLRLWLWMHFCSFVGFLTMTMQVHANSHWPILNPYSTLDQLRDIQDSHLACLEALCRAVEPISITCEMKDDEQLVVLDDPLSVDRVAFPRECLVAIEKTFGNEPVKAFVFEGHDGTGDETTVLRELDLLHLGDISSSGTNIPLFQIRLTDCLFRALLLEYLLEYLLAGVMIQDSSIVSMDSNMVFLIDSIAMEPGDRETVHLGSYICPAHMSRHWREFGVPQLKLIYQALMEWRLTAIMALLYLIEMTYFTQRCTSYFFSLLIPACLLKAILPKNKIRGRRITFFHTFTTLLLLATVLDFRPADSTETIRTGVLVTSALAFHSNFAAMEWCFLYFLSWMRLQTIDWGVSEMVSTFPLRLIPGEGLWKFVFLHAVYRAWPKTAMPQERDSRPVEEDVDKQD